MVRYRHTALAMRGERLALSRLEIGTAGLRSGAPQDEMLQVVGIDQEGRIALQVKFDVEDMDAAMAELGTVCAVRGRSTKGTTARNAASRVYAQFIANFAAHDWDAIAQRLADDVSHDDRRRVVGAGLREGRDAVIADLSAVVSIGVKNATSDIIATRGENLVLSRIRTWGRDQRPEAFHTDSLHVAQVDADERVTAVVVFDPDDFDGAIGELDARYLAGEAAPHARTWGVITAGYAALNRRELPTTTPDLVNIDHRRGTRFAPGDLIEYLHCRVGFSAKTSLNTSRPCID